jgi:hypothetical protein
VEAKNVNKILVRKLCGKSVFARPRNILKNNTKIFLREICCENAGCVE